MLRAPLFFFTAWFAGMLAQVNPGTNTEQFALYTVVGGGIVAGFTAVWVKLWQMHSDWKADKNATILELKTRIKDLEDKLYNNAEAVSDE